jgi:hypothetical protein
MLPPATMLVLAQAEVQDICLSLKNTKRYMDPLIVTTVEAAQAEACHPFLAREDPR